MITGGIQGELLEGYRENNWRDTGRITGGILVDWRDRENNWRDTGIIWRDSGRITGGIQG